MFKMHILSVRIRFPQMFGCILELQSRNKEHHVRHQSSHLHCRKKTQNKTFCSSRSLTCFFNGTLVCFVLLCVYYCVFLCVFNSSSSCCLRLILCLFLNAAASAIMLPVGEHNSTNSGVCRCYKRDPKTGQWLRRPLENH